MHDWVSASDGFLDFILTPKTRDVFVSKFEDKKGGFGGSCPSNSSENFKKKIQGYYFDKSLKFEIWLKLNGKQKRYLNLC